MITYVLVLTFYIYMGTSSVLLPDAVIPTVYKSHSACDYAGANAKKNYNGGAKVEWTCVPSDTTNGDE